ncbi:MAG: hypothetical protein LBB11_04230, partial [Puniceicoccales bacterium]|nr:hypothetical protein [Puniceicoccales bacterium]
MDNKIIEGDVPEDSIPEKLVRVTPKRLSSKITAKTTTIRKPRTKKMASNTSESFSPFPEEVSLICEYSDSVHSVAEEDWSPVATKEAAATSFPCEIEDEKMAFVSEDEHQRPENFPQRAEYSGSESFQGDAHDHGLPQAMTHGHREGAPGHFVNFRETPNNRFTREDFNRRNSGKNPRNEGSYSNYYSERNESPRRDSIHNRGHGGSPYPENPRDGNFKNNPCRGDVQRNDSYRNHQRSFQPNYHQTRRRPATTLRIGAFSIGYLRGLEYLSQRSQIENFCHEVVDFEKVPLYLNEILDKSNEDLTDFACALIRDETGSRAKVVDNYMEMA